MSYSVEVGYSVTFADGGELVSATSAEGLRGKAAAHREGESMARDLRDEAAKFGHSLRMDYVHVFREESARSRDDDEGDARRTVLSVPVPRGLIRHKNARTRRALLRELIDSGALPQPGRCGCSHCANDWDCCGRMVPQRVTLRRINRRESFAVVVIHSVRNV